MIEIIVKKTESGQKLVKLVGRYLKEAPDSFIYKMLRKKNIVLNDKKADGKEVVSEGDSVKVYLAADTLKNFGYCDLGASKDISVTEYEKAYKVIKGVSVIYEENDYLVAFKPAGVLCQKADNKELSLNEWLLGYLLDSNHISKEDLNTFKPSVLNRLDRNTFGLVICSKSYKGSLVLSKWIKERIIDKYYRCIVDGNCNLDGVYTAYHYKDEANNKVYIYDRESDAPLNCRNNLSIIQTEIKAVVSPILLQDTNSDVSEVEVILLTGKTHQIRAHLSHLGYPLSGDVKYAGKKQIINGKMVDCQVLCAYKLLIPSDIDNPESEKKDITCVDKI